MANICYDLLLPVHQWRYNTRCFSCPLLFARLLAPLVHMQAAVMLGAKQGVRNLQGAAKALRASITKIAVASLWRHRLHREQRQSERMQHERFGRATCWRTYHLTIASLPPERTCMPSPQSQGARFEALRRFHDEGGDCRGRPGGPLCRLRAAGARVQDRHLGEESKPGRRGSTLERVRQTSLFERTGQARRRAHASHVHVR